MSLYDLLDDDDYIDDLTKKFEKLADMLFPLFMILGMIVLAGIILFFTCGFIWAVLHG
ncbi:hypothetical protein I6I10_06870 [Corynebacterium glucuronolyticum]|uniref:Uncharacterized protein n=1 Tax=Corynebacterium glucuronolyticum TaxID=39791 RepID=A0A7T4EHS2_9CORY|nr:hypothetical protein [Corynebacterium glucuronolyticum]QQB47584.1 hypothetical protein I6I10_06870 [Corynebacterium glucuronolyticum]WKD64054.1 hypothetical protein CGLUCO_09045 [Corynebacterium glucuronolyticum DSM 44120]SMB82285.1 hypothetical protein SAMN05660745_02609 [Corynebacterium glucuronolyticum]